MSISNSTSSIGQSSSSSLQGSQASSTSVMSSTTAATNSVANTVLPQPQGQTTEQAKTYQLKPWDRRRYFRD